MVTGGSERQSILPKVARWLEGHWHAWALVQPQFPRVGISESLLHLGQWPQETPRAPSALILCPLAIGRHQHWRSGWLVATTVGLLCAGSREPLHPGGRHAARPFTDE